MEIEIRAKINNIKFACLDVNYFFIYICLEWRQGLGVIVMSLSLSKRFNLKILAIGHLVFHTSDYAFDYVLYPFVIYKYGITLATIIMAIGAYMISW